MTKEEIKALISEKIAGQGNQVDAGSALPTILNEIVDMASQSGSGAVVIELGYNQGAGDYVWTPEAEQACVEAFNAGHYGVILKGVDSIPSIRTTPASFVLYGTTLLLVWYNPEVPVVSAKQSHTITIS